MTSSQPTESSNTKTRLNPTELYELLAELNDKIYTLSPDKTAVLSDEQQKLLNTWVLKVQNLTKAEYNYESNTNRYDTPYEIIDYEISRGTTIQSFSGTYYEPTRLSESFSGNGPDIDDNLVVLDENHVVMKKPKPPNPDFNQYLSPHHYAKLEKYQGPKVESSVSTERKIDEDDNNEEKDEQKDEDSSDDDINGSFNNENNPDTSQKDLLTHNNTKKPTKPKKRRKHSILDQPTGQLKDRSNNNEEKEEPKKKKSKHRKKDSLILPSIAKEILKEKKIEKTKSNKNIKLNSNKNNGSKDIIPRSNSDTTHDKKLELKPNKKEELKQKYQPTLQQYNEAFHKLRDQIVKKSDNIEDKIDQCLNMLISQQGRYIMQPISQPLYYGFQGGYQTPIPQQNQIFVPIQHQFPNQYQYQNQYQNQNQFQNQSQNLQSNNNNFLPNNTPRMVSQGSGGILRSTSDTFAFDIEEEYQDPRTVSPGPSRSSSRRSVGKVKNEKSHKSNTSTKQKPKPKSKQAPLPFGYEDDDLSVNSRGSLSKPHQMDKAQIFVPTEYGGLSKKLEYTNKIGIMNKKQNKSIEIDPQMRHFASSYKSWNGTGVVNYITYCLQKKNIDIWNSVNIILLQQQIETNKYYGNGIFSINEKFLSQIGIRNQQVIQIIARGIDKLHNTASYMGLIPTTFNQKDNKSH